MKTLDDLKAIIQNPSPPATSFLIAAGFINQNMKSLEKILSKPEKMVFYANYMQAVIGSCNIPQPNKVMSPVEHAKWTSWNKLGQLPKETAEKSYVDAFIALLDKNKDNSDIQKLIAELSSEKIQAAVVHQTKVNGETITRNAKKNGSAKPAPATATSKGASSVKLQKSAKDQKLTFRFDALSMNSPNAFDFPGQPEVDRPDEERKESATAPASSMTPATASPKKSASARTASVR